jgi:hypothetical protein
MLYVTGGATVGFGDSRDQGGGVLSESEGWAPNSPVVTNCIITGNAAPFGSGAARGLLKNCVLTNNFGGYHGFGGLGGAAFTATLYNCVISGNPRL